MLLAAALLAQSLAASPVEARVTDVALRRTPRGAYNRVAVEFVNRAAAPATLRLCPQDARVDSFNWYGSGWRRVDSAAAFAAGDAESGNWSGGCRDVELRQGEAVPIAYYVRGVPGYKGGYAVRLDTSLGRYRFVSRPSLAAVR